MSSPAPIADLSYRNYDGPLESPRLRSWTVARMTLRGAFKKKSLWVLTFLCGWYYLVMIGVLFVIDQIVGETPNGQQALQQFLERLVWKDQFLHGFGFAQLPLLIVALLVGAGAIANDNRANALLVYLSKPCTQRDYMLGKWLAVFLVVFMAATLPSLVFYGYGALSYRELGFIKDDPWILPKMILTTAFGASLHASLVLAISSLFSQGRLAGATYAGLYFLTKFFTNFMQLAYFESEGKIALVKWLNYASVDGLQLGFCKAILGTHGTRPFGAPGTGRMVPIPPPPLWAPALAIVAITVIGMAVVWRRVRAVEVVG